jgi:hypothetical protein
MSGHGKTFFAVRLLTAHGRRTEETDFPVVHTDNKPRIHQGRRTLQVIDPFSHV